MSAGWLIYWITRLDPIKDSLGWLIFATIVVVPGILFVYGTFKNEDEYGDIDEDKWNSYWGKYKKVVLFSLILGLVLVIANVFLPSSKEMAIMIGIDKLSTNPQINDILNQLYQTIMKLLQSAG